MRILHTAACTAAHQTADQTAIPGVTLPVSLHSSMAVQHLESLARCPQIGLENNSGDSSIW